MGSSKITATRERQILMAHVCSNCGFPIISVVQIHAMSQKSYTFLESKAEEIASETADSAIQYEIERISRCRYTKVALTSKGERENYVAFGHYQDSSISGFDTPCPYCSNVEPWQSSSETLAKLQKSKMFELSVINFPTVFRETNEAEKWACNYVLKLVSEIDQKRLDLLIVEQYVEHTLQSSRNIQKFENQLASIPELKDREMLNTQLQEYIAYKKQIGLFDIKRKKEIGTKINILKLKLNEINEVISIKEQPIIEDIKGEQHLLLHSQAIAFGCTGNIAIKKLSKSFCYYFEPNRIPQDLLETLEDDSADQIETTSNETRSEEYTQDSSIMKNDEIVFCRKCGFKLMPNSVFCTNCGSKIC